MSYVLWFALALSLPGQTPAAPSASPSSKIWIGRYVEFEEYLRTAQIEGSERTPVGVLAPSYSRFVTGGIAKGAAVKNVPPGLREGFFESYKSEIAAYRLEGGALDAMFSRRDTIVKAFEKLAAQKGVNQVFTP